MSTFTIVMIVILVILIGVLVGLYIFGKKAEKKQAEQQEQMAAAAQVVSMLIIDKNLTYYKTPYGQMLVGVNTKNMEISVDEDQIGVKVAYELDVNHEPMADCRINMSIVPRNSKGVSMQLDIR